MNGASALGLFFVDRSAGSKGLETTGCGSVAPVSSIQDKPIAAPSAEKTCSMVIGRSQVVDGGEPKIGTVAVSYLGGS